MFSRFFSGNKEFDLEVIILKMSEMKTKQQLSHYLDSLCLSDINSAKLIERLERDSANLSGTQRDNSLYVLEKLKSNTSISESGWPESYRHNGSKIKIEYL